MIEIEVREYLVQGLDGIPVFLETPERVPEKYVLLERTGGSRRDFLYSSTFAVQSISARSLQEAAELNEQVIGLMTAITAPSVSTCRLNSTYNFTNPETKEHRYQAVFQISHF